MMDAAQYQERIRELEARVAALEKDSEDLELLHCDLASAFNWELQAEPFTDAVRRLKAERDKFHYVLTAIAYASDLMPASILRESALLVCGEKKEAVG